MKQLVLVALWYSAGAARSRRTPNPNRAARSPSLSSPNPPVGTRRSSTSQEIARVMYGNVYEGLVRIDRNGEIVPALAEAWETSDDGLTWTFTLKEGVTFQ